MDPHAPNDAAPEAGESPTEVSKGFAGLPLIGPALGVIFFWPLTSTLANVEVGACEMGITTPRLRQVAER